ncbi:MAG: ADP-ribosylation factor-like protein [Gammaproteobacteria bacterium]|nr:ADP-ribosylation factor-like protein [Gammaproteobacteria bacterium]
MSQSRPVKEIKVVLLGKKNSGKSCFLMRIYQDTFEKMLPTIGVENRVIEFQEDQIKCSLWDTAAGSNLSGLRSYCRGADYAFILVDSKQKLNEEEINEFIEMAKMNANKNCHISIILTKTDSNDKIATIDGLKQLYQNSGYSLGEVSSKKNTRAKVRDLFKSFIHEKPVVEKPIVGDLDLLKNDITIELNKYIKNSFTVLFSRHHHNNRAKAVRNAINQAKSSAEITSILSSQLALISNSSEIAVGSNTNLDERWTNSNKRVNAFSKNSGFRLAIENSDKVLKTFQQTLCSNRPS